MKNNYRTPHFFKGIIVLILLMVSITVSAQITVRVMILPPYSNKLSDYLSRPQQFLLTVQNTTAVNQSIQLRGEFAGDNGVSIRTSPTYKSAAPIRLGPNELRTLGINDIEALFDINKITFTGITKTQFIQQNGVPEGNYQICVQAYDFKTNAPLSDSAPSGCSNIIPVSSVEDPTVIAPFDGNTVSAAAGQNFVISWSTPSGAPPSTQYTVKIAEIFGNKSPADAFTTSMLPIFFQQTVTGINSIVYNQAMPAMTLGRHYALAITAADPTNTVTFKNNGQSVITSFVYGDTTNTGKPVVVTPVKTTDTVIVATPPVNIPATSIAGNVQWYFAQSEENAPPVNSPVVDNYNLSARGSIAHPLNNATVYVSVTPIYKTGLPSAAYQKTLKNLWNPNISQTANEDRENDIEQSAEDMIYQGSSFTTTTDNNGNFQVNVAGVLEGINSNPSKIAQDLGVGGCDSIVVKVGFAPGFSTVAHTYPLSALAGGGSINMGNMSSISVTYRFKPTVVDGSGKQLTDAVINIYRPSAFYAANPYLQYEGNYNANTLPREEVNIDGIMYTKVASLHSGNTASRLYFISPSDYYKIQVQEGDYTTLYSTLSANTTTLLSITLQQTYSMANAPTVFAGTVYKTINGIQNPATGAVVTFVNNYRQFIAQTDSAGNFSLVTGSSVLPYDPKTNPFIVGGITPSVTPVQFVVQYNGQSITDNILIDKAGKTYTKQETINLSSFPVSGHIVDASGNPIPNPVMKWASTGAAIQTDAQGGFSTTNIAGTDSLIISKLSYADKHLGVTIRTDGTVIVPQSAPPPPRGRSIIVFSLPPGGVNGILNAVNGVVGNITLDKNTGKINVYVTDDNGNALPGALVNLDNDPLPRDAVADNNGLVTIIGPSGNLAFDIKGPAGSTYVPRQASYDITGDGTTTTIHLPLQQGVVISGKVTSNGQPVANAIVGYRGQEYGTTVSAEDGSYSIIEPIGSYAMEASKQGYLAGILQGNFNSNQTLNLSLQVSSINITKLLGFPVQVDEIVSNGNSKTISGEFINIPANTMFTAPAGTKLKFFDVGITVQADGTVVPVDDFISTTATNLDLKAFNYLPVTLSNDGDDNHNDVVYLAKRDNAGKHGQIMGMLNIDFTAFIPAGIEPYTGNLHATNSTAPGAEVAVLTDDGSTPGNTPLRLVNDGMPFVINGFNFAVDYANSSVQADGIHLAGSMNFNNIPVLSGTQFNVQVLIGKDAAVSSVTAQPGLKLNIAGWSGQVNSLSFGDNGFTLGGNLSVQIPGTNGSSSVSFSNLQISKDQLYGGNFNLPQSGINLFGIANITGSNVGFGKLGNSNTYYLSGSGNINFTGAAASYLDPVQLTQFQVQTDGKVAVTAKTNIDDTFFGGVAKVDVSQIGINNINGQPRIDVQGSFKLTIPGFSASVGGVHFTSNGGVSVDDIGLGFDVAGIAKASVNVGFENDQNGKGFSGSGSFDIADFANVDVNFHYFAIPGGAKIGTSFSTSTYIPLGTSGLVVSGLGGGFNVNTAKKGDWDIDINGTVAVGEKTFSNAYIDFNVQSGPVITGSAQLSIAGIKGANGKLTIDVPNKLFSVDMSAGLDLAGISATGGGRLVLSLDPTDKYFLLGTYVDISEFNLVNLNGSAIVAYNLNTIKHQRDLASYLTAIPAQFGGGTFTGISASSAFDANLTDMLPNFDVDLGVISLGLHSYFEMKAGGWVTADLTDNPTFSVGFGASWAAGGDVEFKAIDIIDWHAGLAVGFNASFAGTITFGSPKTLKMEATAGAYLHAYFGDIDPGLCINGTNIPWSNPNHYWISVCTTPSLTVGFDSTRSGNPFYIRTN